MVPNKAPTPPVPASPPWRRVTGGPRAVPVRPRIPRCRHATRSAVHESGATPSLTTSRHLLSTPQVSSHPWCPPGAQCILLLCCSHATQRASPAVRLSTSFLANPSCRSASRVRWREAKYVPNVSRMSPCPAPQGKVCLECLLYVSGHTLPCARK
jgi:hypothetical protein